MKKHYLHILLLGFICGLFGKYAYALIGDPILSALFRLLDLFYPY